MIRLPSIVRNHATELAVWTAVLGLAVLPFTGCIIVDDDDDVVYVRDPDHDHDPDEVPLEVRIDAGETLEAEPGDGVGVFVETTSSGAWQIWTTCDTATSGATCAFDACVSVVDGDPDRVGIENAVGDEAEDDDLVETFGDGSACFVFTTADDVDRFRFTTAPGATVRLGVDLDGVPDARFVFWVGDGVLHTGAPTNPVDLRP